MKDADYKGLLKKAKKDVEKRGYNFIAHFVADDKDEIYSGQNYRVSCCAGDLIVILCGRDKGSIEWKRITESHYKLN
jgi:hypothetical protein